MAFLIKNVMTKNVVVVNPEDSVKKAVKLLSAKHIGCLVVIEKDNTLGILTERDILRRIVVPKLDTEKVKTKEIMTKNVITLDSKKTVEDATDLLENKGIKKLPITENGKLVGIVTRTNLLRAIRKIEEEQAEKIRNVCEDLQNTKIKLQTKVNRLERKL